MHRGISRDLAQQMARMARHGRAVPDWLPRAQCRMRCISHRGPLHSVSELRYRQSGGRVEGVRLTAAPS